MTEVLSVRVKKSLKLEAEKLGIDLKLAVEKTLEELVEEKKTNANESQKNSETLWMLKLKSG